MTTAMGGASPDPFDELHEELRKIAGELMRNQGPGHTLRATDLLGEAFLRLGRRDPASYADSRHFLRTAARAMRHLLVDHARRKRAQKRDGTQVPHELDALVSEVEGRGEDLEALDVALEELREADPVMASAVDMRFFGGLGVGEVAAALELSPRTFERRWAATRAWLHKKLA